MAKNVPVTSVTPAIKVKASTEKEKASTRKTIGMIASALPAGKAVKAVASVGKVVREAKAAKAVEKVSTSGYGMGKKGLTISNDVRIKPSTSSSKLKVNPGAKQVIDQNIKTASKTTKTEAKANARGLKAAQKPIKEKPVKKMNRQELNDSIKKQLSNRREQDKRNYPKK